MTDFVFNWEFYFVPFVNIFYLAGIMWTASWMLKFARQS